MSQITPDPAPRILLLATNDDLKIRLEDALRAACQTDIHLTVSQNPAEAADHDGVVVDVSAGYNLLDALTPHVAAQPITIVLPPADAARIDQAASLIASALVVDQERFLIPIDDEHVKRFLSHSADGIMLADPNGQIVVWNDAMTALTGIPASETVGRFIWETVFHVQKDETKLSLADAQMRIEQMLKTGEVPFQESHQQMELARPDGSSRTVDIRISPIRTHNGWATCTLVRDASTVSQTKKDLIDSQRTLATLMDNLPGMVYRCANDAEYTMQFVSPGAKIVTGYEPAELLHGDVTYGSLIHPEDRDFVWLAVQNALKAGEFFRLEYRIYRKNGDERWVWEQGQGVNRHDGTTVLEGFITDITRQKQAEQKLRQSEKRFRTVTENALTGVYIIQDSVFRYVNPAMERIFGYASAELVDRLGPADLTHPDDRGLATEYIRQRIEGEIDSIEYTFRGLCKDGEIIHCHVMGSRAVFDGRPAIVGMLLDVTKRYEAEQAAARDRRLADALLDVASAISSTLKLDEVLDRLLINVERITHHDAANVMLIENGVSRVVRQRGYPPGEPSEAIANTSFLVNETPNLRLMMETGETLIIDDIEKANGWTKVPGAMPMRSYAGAPIMLDEKTIGFISMDSKLPGAFGEEIADALRGFADQAGIAIRNARMFSELEYYSSILEEAIDVATSELRGMVDRVEIILKNSPDPTLLLTDTGTIDLANPAFQRILGYQPGEVITQPVHTIFPDESGQLMQRELAALSTSTDARRFEATVQRKDGSTLVVNVALSPVPDEDKLRGIVCTLHDISELKELERMKDTFLSTAAHELRTPLTSIQGFSEILLTRQLPPERQTTYLNYISQQAVHLAAIINDLLDVSRLQSGKSLSIKPEPISLDRVVERVLLPFMEISGLHRFETKNLDHLPQALADPFRLEQVIRNLVSNAVKYSPEGGRVTISGQMTDGVLAIQVADEGIGLTPDQIPHVFEPFYRTDMAQASATGTGLGLSISRAIIEMHGGSITVHSTPHKGSTFTFTLPLA